MLNKWDAIFDTIDVSYFTIVISWGTPDFLHASLSICEQLLKIFCHQAMHQPKNVAMVFLLCGRGSTQCIRVFVMRRGHTHSGSQKVWLSCKVSCY